jgi:toxin secretion/phage lysis holin
MTATNIKNSILTVLAAVGSFIANQLGGWDIALGVLIAFIALDYITGLLVAGVFKKSEKTEDGKLSSAASLKGLIRKGVMLLIVWVACLLDTLTGADYVRTAVILFFIGNEGLSIIENVGLMGVPLPKFLKNALEAMKDKNDDPTAKQ